MSSPASPEDGDAALESAVLDAVASTSSDSPAKNSRGSDSSSHKSGSTLKEDGALDLSRSSSDMPNFSHSDQSLVFDEECDGWDQATLAHNGRFYTSPHKIDYSVWNSSHEICALASVKGEVSVRRMQGKQGWRTELSGETGVMWADDAELSKKSTELLAICWSPGGEILACSMNSGLVHFLDVEHGRIMYTLRVNKPFNMIRWFSVIERDRLGELNFADYDHLAHCKTPEFSMKTDSQMNNKEESKEMKDLENFVNIMIPNCLTGTVLVGACSVDDGLTVELYAAGVLRMTGIEPNLDGKLKSEVEVDPTSLKIQAIHMDPILGSRTPLRLWIAYSVLGRAKPMFCPELGTEMPNPESEEVACGYHSLLFGYDLRLSDTRYLANVMGLAKRTALLYHTVALLREIYSYMVKDWTTQLNFFQNRWKMAANDTVVKRPNVDYCSSLLDALLTGQMSPIVHTYLADNAKEIGTGHMHKFLDERFSELIQILSGPLTVAGHIIHYQIIQLLEQFVAFKETDRVINVFDDSVDVLEYSLFGESTLNAPPRIEYANQRELQKAKEAVILLGKRIFETKIVSFANRKDLKMLVKYFSICPPIAGNLKAQKREELFRANDTFEAQPLINYIIATFGNYELCDNDQIRNQVEDPLEQMLVKLQAIRSESKENTREHSVAIEAKAHDPQLDRISDYFSETLEGTNLPTELELNAQWEPMWTEHHSIDEQEFNNLKDSHRTLKQSVDLMRKMFVELTQYVGSQVSWDHIDVDVHYVELSHPSGFDKVVLASWEDAREQDVTYIDYTDHRDRARLKSDCYIPAEKQKTARLKGLYKTIKDIPRIVYIGKRATDSVHKGLIRPFALAKNEQQWIMAHIGWPCPTFIQEQRLNGSTSWESRQPNTIVDFEYTESGMIYGVAAYPEKNNQHGIFKASIFANNGYLDLEFTKNRKIEKVSLSPFSHVGIVIAPPISKNTTSSKFGMFNTRA